MKKNFFCAKTELLNCKITLPLPESDMVGSKLVSNSLIFLDDMPVNIQLVNFCCYLILVN